MSHLDLFHFHLAKEAVEFDHSLLDSPSIDELFPHDFVSSQFPMHFCATFRIRKDQFYPILDYNIDDIDLQQHLLVICVEFVE